MNRGRVTTTLAVLIVAALSSCSSPAGRQSEQSAPSVEAFTTPRSVVATSQEADSSTRAAESTGTGTAPPTSPAVPSAAPSPNIPTSNAATPPTRPTRTQFTTSATTGGIAACPDPDGDASTFLKCARPTLVEFWSAELSTKVAPPIIVDPTMAEVPMDCQVPPEFETAFMCPINKEIYVMPAFAPRLERDLGAESVRYALMVTLGHEFGHVVQLTTDPKAFDAPLDDRQASIEIEQQADCLSGVWSSHLATQGSIDSIRYREVASRFFTSLDSEEERFAHGLVKDRMAAFDKGAKHGIPKDCGITTEH